MGSIIKNVKEDFSQRKILIFALSLATNLKEKIMAFGQIFKDKNDINEKSVVGFMSFAVMVLAAVVDLATGYVGKDLIINEFIYNSFLIVTLGCFGIAGAEKIFGKKNNDE